MDEQHRFSVRTDHGSSTDRQVIVMEAVATWIAMDGTVVESAAAGIRHRHSVVDEGDFLLMRDEARRADGTATRHFRVLHQGHEVFAFDQTVVWKGNEADRTLRVIADTRGLWEYQLLQRVKLGRMLDR